MSAPDTTERLRSGAHDGFAALLPAGPIAIALGRSIVRRSVVFRSDDAQSRFLVALTEIITNAVDEHQRLVDTQPIRLAVNTHPRDEVTVTDLGRGFADQTDPIATDLPASAERGRGLALALAFVPDLAVVSGPSGTTITLPLAGMGVVR